MKLIDIIIIIVILIIVIISFLIVKNGKGKCSCCNKECIYKKNKE